MSILANGTWRPEDYHDALVDEVGDCMDDPLGYVMASYDWANDYELQIVELPEEQQDKYHVKHGPDPWAIAFLLDLGAQIKGRKFDGTAAVDPVQMAAASGHGIGKSTITGWLVGFLGDTRYKSKGIVTANTGTQLHTKTWAEIKKWRRKSLLAGWWVIGDKAIRHNADSGWGVNAITWKKEQSEAFAGQHAASSSSYYIFDEASAIERVIFEVSEGGLTDGEPFRFLFGNPTRNSGFFYDVFHRLRHRWLTYQIDSRDVAITNKRLFQEWIDDFGEDSDFVRVRVKGQFPRASSRQLIAADVIRMARARKPEEQALDTPTVLGVDVARHGDAESVIAIRRGMDAASVPWRVFRGLDNMQLAARVVELIEMLRRTGTPPAAVFVDGGGNGSGVIDRLRQLGYHTHDVLFGGRADRADRYKNKSAEMWGRTRDWLKGGGALPEGDDVLAEQLQNREYDWTATQQLFLESKDDLEKRGLDSPDRADALVLTFAFSVSRQTPAQTLTRSYRAEGEEDYDPFE